MIFSTRRVKRETEDLSGVHRHLIKIPAFPSEGPPTIMWVWFRCTAKGERNNDFQ